MVWTFTHKEPSSFETLVSQFSCTRRCAKLGLWSDPKSEFYWILVRPKVRVLWDQKSVSRPTGVSNTNMPSGYMPEETQMDPLVNDKYCCGPPEAFLFYSVSLSFSILKVTMFFMYNTVSLHTLVVVSPPLMSPYGSWHATIYWGPYLGRSPNLACPIRC